DRPEVRLASGQLLIRLVMCGRVFLGHLDQRFLGESRGFLVVMVVLNYFDVHQSFVERGFVRILMFVLLSQLLNDGLNHFVR
ncbi:hypothetical protein A2U01_0075325, partial [Trifolium medium]|nr:hypothetical protein [Trifolium medium]